MAQSLQGNSAIPPKQQPQENEEHDNGVQLSAASTFVECFPRKVRTGGPHPHTIVETAAMNAVEPPDVTINVSIPEAWIDNGALSCVQMEAIIYACQSHEQRLPNGWRKGFLIGDGAGVGKGRTIAGIIVHNYELKRKRSIWLSVSSDLRFDTQRDVEDVAGKDYCPIHHLSKFKYGNIRAQQKSTSKGIMFATYASLVGKSKAGESRLQQLIEWFGENYDGCIIFDECHRAKNLCPKSGTTGSSMIGKCVVDLQRALPNARIVYASATGATEPRNMAYMERLGLWGAGTVFHDFGAFLDIVNRRGMGAMELVAMDMKRRGLYIARQLSFFGVDFNVHEVPLTMDYKKVYDESVAFWTILQTQFTRAFELLAAQNKKSYKNAWTHFYSAAQRFFKHLCIAVKVPMCVEISKKALEQGKCVVIGLQATGESQTNEALGENEGELETFVSTPKQLLISLIEKYFPVDPDDDFDGKDPLKSLFRGIDSEERKWKRKHAHFDVDEMEKEAKRSKLIGDDESEEADEQDNKEESGESSEDNESEEEDSEEEEEEKDADMEEEEVDSGNEDDGYGEIDNSQNDLVAELMNELSTDSEADDIENSDTEGSPKNADSDEDERAIKLFCTDYSNMDHDPWAKRQRFVSETTFEKPIPISKNNNKKSTIKKIKKKPKEIKPKVEKISDYAKKITEEMKSADQECSNSESYDSGFNNELLTMDLSKIRPTDVSSTLLAIKEELLDRASKIGETLPINTLDALIDQLGGPECVAEMTGRRGRVVRDAEGVTSYKRRNDGENVNLDLINIQEKDYFMNGQKFIAIISEAASSGISLHADRRAINKRKRVHITMELPWSADKAVQQFGRTHRSNQEQPPEYLFLISELAGEKRFVSTASKRLQSLGALTHGDRRAVAESDDLSRFSIENKYGKQALQMLYKTFIDPKECPIRPKNLLADVQFFQEARGQMIRNGILKEINGLLNVDRENGLINKFLNRLLLMPVDIQNSIFDYYMSIFAYLVRRAKLEGTYDTGTLDLGSTSDHITRAETRIFGGRLTGTSFELLLHKIHIDRGMTWDDVKGTAALYSDGVFADSTTSQRNGRKNICFVYENPATEIPMIVIVRPNINRTQKPGTIETFLSNHQKYTDMEECKKMWDLQYKSTANQCLHKFNNATGSSCKQGGKCEVGQRIRSYFVCSGAVLTAWQAVEKTFEKFKRNHIQIVRIQTNENQKLVGLLVNPLIVEHLISELKNLYHAKLIRTF
uniref:Uncharacterized protein n=1 Tax=Panagrolaimus superbus TaxID=310955 RepID=A0A914Y3P1_9BILA